MLLVIKDKEKAFNSLDSFLMSVFKKIRFGENFVDWRIKILLYKQELRVVNGCFTTKYVNLEKKTCQGDPISAYLFILALKIIFFTYKKQFFNKSY